MDQDTHRVMKTISLLILLSSFSKWIAAKQDICPPWFFPDNRSISKCSCIDSDPYVKCSSEFPSLQFGFCMTYDNATETTEFGPCPYIAHYNTTITTVAADVLYIRLPKNVSLLNEFMCGSFNREGTLCAKCKDGYGTGLYSYTLECSKCWGHGYGWVLYYFLELFPITVLYFLVVIFHIRATSSPMSALVFMSQTVVYIIRLHVPLHMYIENEVTGFPYIAWQVLLVLCGIWSLDFFRSVIPPFCVSSNIKTVHALALEYLVAFYPIFLILLTYVCIKLHDNNFRPVVWLWKPFHRHFAHLRRRWDSTASIINAFTTFLLLSFSKIIFVSFTLLHTLSIRYVHYNSLDIERKCVLYYDPTVECNQQEYSIFAAIAGCALVIFIICPTVLLILYPTRLFRKCLSCCGFRRWYALHMFVESFQGQYKDGTNGTHDFRMVSASFLIIRILVMASFLPHHFTELLQCAILICAAGFYAIVRPYKSDLRNNVDFLILALLGILSIGLLFVTYHPVIKHFKYAVLITTLFLGSPHMVLTFYVCYVLAKKAGITQYLKMKYARCELFTSQRDMEAESDGDFMPDRLTNPGEYRPLLSSREEPTDSKEPVSENLRRLTPFYTDDSIK